MKNNHLKAFGVAIGVAIGTIPGTVSAGIPGQPGFERNLLSSSSTVLRAGSFESSQNGPFKSPNSSSTNPKIHGKTYGEWAAEWAKWAYSFPNGENPIQDLNGENCSAGQSGKVFFLAGSDGLTEVKRYCTIPANRAIFYPIISSTWVDFPGESGEPGDEIYSDEEVSWILASFTPGGDQACKINSTLDTLTDMPNFGEVPAPVTARLRPVVRAQSPKSTIVLPEDNLFGIPAGKNDRLMVEGVWVMLPPMKPGEHVLTLHGTGCDESEEQDGVFVKKFETEVTYYLTVVR